MPYALENLSGKVIIEPDLVTVDIRGKDPEIKIAGHIRQHREKQSVELAVVAQDVGLDEKLKVILPENVKFKPHGESPLKSSKKFVNTACPKCNIHFACALSSSGMGIEVKELTNLMATAMEV